MVWDNIIGQHKAKALLVEQLNNGKHSHAYLFIGPEGVGKKLTAETFARALNCQDAANRPCDNCPSCRTILHNNSISISYFKPTGKKIKIDDIRNLCKHINLKQENDASKVIIIDDADKMTTDAANNLLKTLEEPPVRTHFILMAEEKAAILPTIISRCQVVLFAPISAKEIAAYLHQKYSLSQDIALTLAKISQGSLGNAEKMALDDEFNTLREIAQEIMTAKTKDAYDVLQLSQQLDDNKDQLFEILEMLRLLVRDVLVYKTGGLELIINKDKEAVLAEQEGEVEDFLRKYHAVDEAINRLKYNANRRLTLDIMLLELKFDRSESA